MSRLTKEQIERLDNQVRLPTFFGILVNREYIGISFHRMDTCCKDILMASMKVAILQLFQKCGQLPDFDFQEMYVSLMTPFFQNKRELQDEIIFLCHPGCHQNLSNNSVKELTELILDFARYIGLELFYTCVKELCLCTKKPISHFTYTYFILNKENYINFIKCLYKKDHGDFDGKTLMEYLNPDLIKYHYEHNL